MAERAAFISCSFFPLGQGDASDLPDPELEVNEPKVLIISNQYTISAGLARVRKNKSLEKTTFKFFLLFSFLIILLEISRRQGERGLRNPRGRNSAQKNDTHFEKKKYWKLCIRILSETCPLPMRTGGSER